MDKLSNTQLLKDIESSEYRTRWFAAEVVGTRRDLTEDQLNQLIRLMYTSDVAEVICWGLGQMQYEQAIPDISRMLSNPNNYYKWRAAEALRDVGTVSAVNALENELLVNADPETRWRCAWALGEIGKIIANETLWKIALADSDSYVRWRSIWALSKLTGDVEKFVMDKLIHIDDEFAQWRGIWLIGQVGTKSSVKWLKGYVQNNVTSRYVKYQYTIALEKLEGKNA